jgi:NTE family protein
LFFTLALSGQPIDGKPKIGLVLSGGGAKGFAHVGVLKVLEEAKIPVDYIAGTSVGSIVGGLYACGYDAATLVAIVKSQDWRTLLSNEYKQEFIPPFDKTDEARYNVSFPFEEKKLALSNGVFNGQNAMELFSYLTFGFHDVSDFSKLPIPFLCIATDLTNGEEVILDKGYLPKAMRASMSIPAAFTSTEINGRMLIDGGIINNFPADRCREMGADIIIGVDITDSLKTDTELKGIPEVIAQMMSFMGKERNNENTKEVDIHIRPYIHDYSAASFDEESAEILIRRGEDAARRVLPRLIHLRDSLQLKAKPRTLHDVPPDDTTLVISQIEVTGTDRAKIAFYLGQTGIKRDQHVTLEHLRNGISRLYATGNYDFVNYQLAGDTVKTLKVEVKERKNNKINAGLHYDSDLRSAMLVNITIRNQEFFGSRLSLDAKLSQYPMFSGQYSIDRGWKPGFYSKLMYVADRIYTYEDGKKIAEIDMSLLSLQLATHSFMTDATRFTLGVSMDSYALGSVIGDTTGYDIKAKTYFNLFSRIEHNRLDKIYFPTRGTNITVGAKMVINKGYNPFLIGDFVFKRARSFSDRITVLYTINSRLIYGKNESFFHKTFLGGSPQTNYMENNMPFNGLYRMQLSTNNVFAGRLETRLRLWEKIYFALIGDFGLYSEDDFIYGNGKPVYGFGMNAAYDSLVGPMEINLSFSNYNKDIIPFLSLGYWF